MSAIKELGYAHAPAINHGAEFRSRETGFHSNDIESEFNRLKRWLRQRYGVLHIGGAAPSPEILHQVESEEDIVWDDLDVAEYTFYSNVGSDMQAVMDAFVHYNGGRKLAVDL